MPTWLPGQALALEPFHGEEGRVFLRDSMGHIGDDAVVDETVELKGKWAK